MEHIKPPIQVNYNIHTLRHLAYIAGEMTKIQCGWIPGTAYWELKLHLAKCQWEDATHANELRKRLEEFPTGRPDGDIRPQIRTLMEVVAAAPHGPAFIQGFYGAFKPYVLSLYRAELEETDAIVDAVTVDALEKAAGQVQRQIEIASGHYAQWNVTEEEAGEAEQWKEYILKLLDGIGALDNECEPDFLPYYRMRPSPVALRDDRFIPSFRLEAPDLGPTATEEDTYEIKVVMTYFKEMQATETVASSLYETVGMPWSFYYETSRHCWDEARHCMLGQRRMEQLGFGLTQIKSMNGNYAVRQLLDPLYRYTYITMVEEANSMKGKREWVDTLERMGKTLTARLVEYDIVDERHHVNNGFRWIPEILKHRGDKRTLQEVIDEAKRLRRQAFELLQIDQES